MSSTWIRSASLNLMRPGGKGASSAFVWPGRGAGRMAAVPPVDGVCGAPRVVVFCGGTWFGPAIMVVVEGGTAAGVITGGGAIVPVVTTFVRAVTAAGGVPRLGGITGLGLVVPGRPGAFVLPIAAATRFVRGGRVGNVGKAGGMARFVWALANGVPPRRASSARVTNPHGRPVDPVGRGDPIHDRFSAIVFTNLFGRSTRLADLVCFSGRRNGWLRSRRRRFRRGGRLGFRRFLRWLGGGRFYCDRLRSGSRS